MAGAADLLCFLVAFEAELALDPWEAAADPLFLLVEPCLLPPPSSDLASRLLLRGVEVPRHFSGTSWGWSERKRTVRTSEFINPKILQYRLTVKVLCGLSFSSNASKAYHFVQVGNFGFDILLKSLAPLSTLYSQMYTCSSTAPAGLPRANAPASTTQHLPQMESSGSTS